MQIWTTPQLQETIVEQRFPVAVHATHLLRNVFLDRANPGDIAVVPAGGDDAAFLSAVRRKQLTGPVIFITQNPAVPAGTHQDQRALSLDVTVLGFRRIRELLSFILDMALERLPVDLACPLPAASAGIAEEVECGDHQQCDGLPDGLLAEGARAIASFSLIERGEPVTMRGACILKTGADGQMVKMRFHSPSLFRYIKPAMPVTLLIEHRDRRFQTSVEVARVDPEGLVAEVPCRFISMTRRFVRVEPSLRQPIAVSVLVPGLPTYTTAALEVSRRGVALLGTGVLSPGQTYAFLIQLPDPSAVIACYGSVRSKRERDDGFRYGIELQVHPKDEELLCRYIMNREREIAGLAREP